MKFHNKLAVVAITAIGLGVTGCNDYLDINTNPNNPTSDDALFQQRLPWMQFYMEHAYHITASNSTFYTGNFVRPGAAREKGATVWNLGASTRAANCQQWFFTMVGNNLAPLYDQAMAAGAYHYAACSKFFRAYGFMMLTDVFGEIPYNDAFGENPSPKYDTGRTVFMGCIADIDEAIKLFGRDQEKVNGVTPPSLAEGDTWNHGDVQKWIKMCYLLKARWINHLSKKDAGKYTDGKYDAQEILACLDKAMQNNGENTIVPHEDTNTSSHDKLGWDEPVDYNAMYSCIGMNSNIYITKTYYDNLTNFGGYGVEDPRADKLIPWTRSEKSASTPAEIKWTDDGRWRRSLGVDLQTSILSESGPYALSYKNKSWYCDNESRSGDTVYVWTSCGGTGYYKGTDQFYYRSKWDERSRMSGIQPVRPTAYAVMAGYPEACFIRAEVLMRKGEKGAAFQAYKNGIRAHIDFINSENARWLAETPSMDECPAFTPMTDEQIQNFLDNGIGTEADLTTGKIITQKLIAMPFTGENWNDMRRFDYDPQIFLNWNIAKDYYDHPTYWDYCPQGKQPRRWAQASYELTYNTANLQAIGAQVPGANELNDATTGLGWYGSKLICTLPIWWDSTQE